MEVWWTLVQYGFHFNAKRCTGCKTCMLSCKDYHDLPPIISFRQVYEYTGGSWEQDKRGLWANDCFAYYVSVSCNHCVQPECTRVCPTGAMHKDDMGFVSVDNERCVGCGYCAFACPYKAPKVDRKEGHSSKCDGCKERVRQSLEPICVESCPLRALDFGLIETLYEKYGTVASIEPLADATQTHPSLVITEPRHSARSENGEGSVANYHEIV